MLRPALNRNSKINCIDPTNCNCPEAASDIDLEASASESEANYLGISLALSCKDSIRWESSSWKALRSTAMAILCGNSPYETFRGSENSSWISIAWELTSNMDHDFRFSSYFWSSREIIATSISLLFEYSILESVRHLDKVSKQKSDEASLSLTNSSVSGKSILLVNCIEKRPSNETLPSRISRGLRPESRNAGA